MFIFIIVSSFLYDLFRIYTLKNDLSRCYFRYRLLSDGHIVRKVVILLSTWVNVLNNLLDATGLTSDAISLYTANKIVFLIQTEQHC